MQSCEYKCYIFDEVRKNLLLNSFGRKVNWDEVRAKEIACAIAHNGNRRESYYEGFDGICRFEIVKENDLEFLGRKSDIEVVNMLSVKNLPMAI
ncbi:MAG: hypothetical protein QW087_02135 [Methanomassiliicoccales archaeon]